MWENYSENMRENVVKEEVSTWNDRATSDKFEFNIGATHFNMDAMPFYPTRVDSSAIAESGPLFGKTTDFFKVQTA